jgi:5-methylthioribose kinase
VRASTERLDIEDERMLVSYLRAEGRLGEDEDASVTVLQGGVSNRTVLVERPTSSWVLKQALERLRVPVIWLSDPDRVHREAAALRLLEQITPEGSIPGFVFEDRRHHLLCMEAVPKPHDNWKQKLLAGQVVDAEFERFGVLLGVVHRESRRRLSELSLFADRSFFESLRLDPYYLYTAKRVPAAAPFLTDLVTTTRTIADCLVHGDYSPKNLLVRQGRLVLLDHEVVHLGDPAFDLGFSLAHLLSKSRHLPASRDALVTATFRYLAAYRAEGTVFDWPKLERRAVQHALACLLARARGRSQLEYLDEDEKDRQETAVLRLLGVPPVTVAGLAEGFLA